MKTYAFIRNREVSEIILPATDPEGIEIPIEERFTSDFVEHMVDVTGMKPPVEVHWKYIDGEFRPSED